MSPRFPICLPTYNRADLLEFCLERIAQRLPQGVQPWYEVIVSDNASTDRTPEVLRARQGAPGLRVLRRGSNGGHVTNLINVLRHATAPLVVFLSDDDALMPEPFERYVERLEANPRLAGIYADVSCYDDQNSAELHRYWRDPRAVVFDPAGQER